MLQRQLPLSSVPRTNGSWFCWKMWGHPLRGTSSYPSISHQTGKGTSLTQKYRLGGDTVDGWNPATPEMYKTLRIMGETTNLNRCMISSINSMFVHVSSKDGISYGSFREDSPYRILPWERPGSWSQENWRDPRFMALTMQLRAQNSPCKKQKWSLGGLGMIFPSPAGKTMEKTKNLTPFCQKVGEPEWVYEFTPTKDMEEQDSSIYDTMNWNASGFCRSLNTGIILGSIYSISKYQFKHLIYPPEHHSLWWDHPSQ